MSTQVPIYLGEPGIVCALGTDLAAVRHRLFDAEAPAPLPMDTTLRPGHALGLGWAQTRPGIAALLPAALRSRNNALLLSALAQIRAQVDAALAAGPERFGIVLGTSTSGIGESEQAFASRHREGHFPKEFDLAQQELGSPATALAEHLGALGPAYVVSTACSSAAKALASAARLLRAGVCDSVLAGGADSLCAFTVAGFQALEAVSPLRCNPFSVHRAGIHIGEGAALFLLSRAPISTICLSGAGESSDAHHMSAPDPTGRGAIAAMQQALNRAGLAPEQIDYINLHGTATVHNDAMESLAVHTLFGDRTAASSTKPLSGHALGAAGALEAAFGWLCLHGNPEGQLPPHWWDGQADPALPALALVPPHARLGRPLRHVLSNSFAFGGNNISLVLSRLADGHD